MLDVCRRGHIIGDIRVIGAQIDHHEIRCLLLAKVPRLRLISTSRKQVRVSSKFTQMIRILQLTSPDLRSTPARVHGVEPLMTLSSRGSPALLVGNANTWEGRD